ncbi:MAG TPA: endolytic transglycosylase MltG [Candidatus Paceibacterota bacterium]|nr:endolytic transglycosylase MltG [Candidatus Paceibacterota bacterium]HPT40189.1 endolytic transglycosylase MltG [Candidatus Paceibacterota bacterium]
MREFFLTVFIIYTVLFGFFICVFNYQLKPIQTNATGEAVFVVEKGQGFQEISDNLAKAGLIRSRSSFKLYLLVRGWADKLQPGSYHFALNFSSQQIAKILVEDALEEITVTIPEGWTLSMVDERLKEEGVLVSGSLSSLKVKDFSDKNSNDYFEFLSTSSSEASLEGFIFPDTYRFYKNISARAVAKKFLSNFEEKFSREMEVQMQKQGLNFQKTVILASLVESEIPHDIDRPKVAGILLKRLSKNMPLQLDATIIYIKCEIKKLSDCRKITSSDFKIKSDYNTYLNRGLPVGPISNPGLGALKAALYPESSAYLFYLSDPATGNTIFSRTLEEHNLNKERYL